MGVRAMRPRKVRRARDGSESLTDRRGRNITSYQDDRPTHQCLLAETPNGINNRRGLSLDSARRRDWATRAAVPKKTADCERLSFGRPRTIIICAYSASCEPRCESGVGQDFSSAMHGSTERGNVAHAIKPGHPINAGATLEVSTY